MTGSIPQLRLLPKFGRGTIRLLCQKSLRPFLIACHHRLNDHVMSWICLLKEIAVKTVVSHDVDDFDTFINASPIALNEGCTPLMWWSQPEQRSRYPRLHQMAIAILSIPAESAEPERTFSGARRTCSWDRLSITCENLEIIECLGNWLKQGLVIPLSAGGMGLFVSPPPEIDIERRDNEIVASIE
jgi:hypothetical protein